MIRTYLIPLLAIAGVLLAIYTVVQGSKPVVPKPLLVEPPRAPFEAFVAGSGLVEASTQNIALGTPVPGVVSKVHVRVAQDVQPGEELFEIDARELRAELQARLAAVDVAAAQLEKLRLGTRPEQLPAARARVAEARAALGDAQAQLARWENVQDARAVSEDELIRRRFAVMQGEARLSQAESELALLEAGSWSADVAIAESQLASARAQAQVVQAELDRRVVRAPVAGRVLQLNLRPGEFAVAGSLPTPLMVMGSVDPLHVRVDIDENDAWRVRAGARAIAYVRGNKDIASELEFVRFEPYVIPKKSLTGESTERVDTRVLQVIYAISKRDLGVFVGQQMDIFVEAEPLRIVAPAPGK